MRRLKIFMIVTLMLVLLAMLLLTGCSEDEGKTSTVTPIPTETPTLTVTPPPEPARIPTPTAVPSPQPAETPVPTEVTVTDLAGREVTVKYPVEKVVLGSARYLHEFAAVGGEEVLDKIVGWGTDLEKYDKDTLEKYVEAFPELTNMPDVGYSSTRSVEKIISLQPDVAVFPFWSAENEGLLADIDKLDKAGIPSVFLDYWSEPYEHPVPSTLLIGTLLGEEERAREIIDYYQQQLDIVTDRLLEIGKQKPEVYVEVGSKGPSTCGNTYGNSGLGAVVVRAGGTNIAEDGMGLVEGTKQINQEFLIDANPEVILISGSKWENPESMQLGYYATVENSRARLAAFTERTGWDTLDAVNNGRVHSSFHGFSFRIFNFVGVQAFAKWFYPEEFADLDPEANFKEFHEKFLPVDFSGVWTISVTE
ncbi:MAG: ABC transporter substrate-binding protein [Chloroflexota bacterium]|nr:ABC transporter substrate-binding protein [Chloroflexota bacterium]